MTWLTWRLHRTEALWAGALVGLSIAAMFAVRGDVVDTYLLPIGGACPEGPLGCDYSIETAGLATGLIVAAIPGLTAVPILAAIALIAPLLLERQNGEAQWAWTQGSTRLNQLLRRVVLVTMAAMLPVAAVHIATGFWEHPRAYGESWYQLGSDAGYELRGVLPYAVTFFAVGLVLAVGSVVRQPLLAVIGSALLFGAVRVGFIVGVRPHLVSPVVLESGSPDGGWRLGEYWLAVDGTRYSDAAVYETLCPDRVVPGRGGLPTERCIDDLGLRLLIEYQPLDRYWRFQAIESAIFVAVALVLVTLAICRMAKRDA